MDGIDSLTSDLNEAADEIAGYMAEMATEEDRRDFLYYAVLAILAMLRTRFREWLDNSLRNLFIEADNAAIADLGAAGVLSTPQWNDIMESVFQSLRTEAEDGFDKSLDSIKTMASRFRRGSIPEDLQQKREINTGLSATILVSLHRSRLRPRIRDSLVRITGSDGRVHKFELSYFANLVAVNAKFSAFSRAAVARSGLNGHDLVQCSPQPSTIGDFCDAYRGQVFSISGADPDYPPMSSMPGGGAPMHPRCHHYLIPYTGGKKASKEIPASLAQLGPTTKPYEFQKAWENVNG